MTGQPACKLDGSNSASGLILQKSKEMIELSDKWNKKRGRRREKREEVENKNEEKKVKKEEIRKKQEVI